MKLFLIIFMKRKKWMKIFLKIFKLQQTQKCLNILDYKYKNNIRNKFKKEINLFK